MKNKGFYIVLIITLVTLGTVGVLLELKKRELAYQKKIISQESSSQSSVVVRQSEVNIDHKFSGKVINQPNEASHIELSWSFNDQDVIKSEIYLNDKLIKENKLSDRTTTIDVIQHDLKPEGNEFTLLLTLKDGTKIPSKIVVSVGYIYNMSYFTNTINDQLFLEYSYYTNASSPVSLPQVKESGKMRVELVESPLYEESGNYRKITLRYKLDISAVEAGKHREIILWNIGSINYDFSQVIEFYK